jgi:hypothetical protein
MSISVGMSVHRSGDGVRAHTFREDRSHFVDKAIAAVPASGLHLLNQEQYWKPRECGGDVRKSIKPKEPRAAIAAGEQHIRTVLASHLPLSIQRLRVLSANSKVSCLQDPFYLGERVADPLAERI